MGRLGGVSTFVLVGGLGTRLRPAIGEDTPKPLAMIDGEPFLQRLLAWASAQGIQNVILGTGHLADRFEHELTSYAQEGMTIRFSVEDHPLGTGGAIVNALPMIDSDPFLVMNGDSIVDACLESLIDFHMANQADVTIALARVDDSARFGTVCIEDSGRVYEFREKTGDCVPGNINAGMYVVSRSLADSLPKDKVFSFEKGILARCEDHRFFGNVFDSPFIDIGTPDSYREASEFFQRFS